MSASLLVVDDNEMNRDLLQRRLGKAGYDVTAVEDGYQALDLLGTRSFDLVILDIVMPGMNGLDVLRALRLMHSPAALPVIMATARNETDDMVEAMQLGATDYVTKPINIPVLQARIQAQLSMRRKGDDSDSLSLGELGPGGILDGRYQLEAEVGRGGFSVVYKARQISTGQPVAIKIIRPDLAAEPADAAAERDRFVHEMKIIGSLNHPHIVRLIDTGALAEGHLYTVLEYVEGRTLHEVIREEGLLQPMETKRLLLQVLEALSCAHAKGVIHLDLKPANIMVVSTGARRSAMVLDFGLAEIAHKGQYLPSQLRGTPAYMAPEHLRKEPLSPACDLYAWGLIFIEALTGQLAIQRASRGSIILEHLSQVPVRIPGHIVSAELRALLARAVAKDVRQRFSSAEEVMAVLEGLGQEQLKVMPPRRPLAGPADPTAALPGEDANDTRTPFLDLY